MQTNLLEDLKVTSGLIKSDLVNLKRGGLELNFGEKKHLWFDELKDIVDNI